MRRGGCGRQLGGWWLVGWWEWGGGLRVGRRGLLVLMLKMGGEERGRRRLTGHGDGEGREGGGLSGLRCLGG